MYTPISGLQQELKKSSEQLMNEVQADNSTSTCLQRSPTRIITTPNDTLNETSRDNFTGKRSHQEVTPDEHTTTSPKKKHDVDTQDEENERRLNFEKVLCGYFADDGSRPLTSYASEEVFNTGDPLAASYPSSGKSSMVTQLLDICTENEITSHAALARYCNEHRDCRKYLIMGRSNAYTQVFEAVKSMLTQSSLFPRIKFEATEQQESKIYKLLQYQGFKDDGIKNFAVNLFKCTERLTGKRNTFLVWGASNTGKSQLMETYCRTYFPSAIGMPTNNVRSSFPWGNCPNNRILLWEEPLLTEENIEDFKKIGGGQIHHVDVKYMTNVEIEHTPMIMTANKPPWAGFAGFSSYASEVKNRCFIYKLNKPITETENFFPIVADDWHRFFSLYEQELRAIVDS